jgi:hypothetical protein
VLGSLQSGYSQLTVGLRPSTVLLSGRFWRPVVEVLAANRSGGISRDGYTPERLLSSSAR